MFVGVYTALITPFKDGAVDYVALDKILEDQIKNGVTGVLPMGTTGESPTVSHDEHIDIVKHVVDTVKGRVKVVAGTGSNSTAEAIRLSKRAEECGVDAVLVVNPYYNRPSQRCLIEHFAAVAESVSVPVMLYNIPGRTGVNFEPESILELCNRAKNVLAIKEAAGSMAQVMRIIELLGDRIQLMIGDDALLLPTLAVGGTGVVSVLSNIMPAKVVEVIDTYNGGDLAKARDLFYKMMPLCRLMFVETNPIPIKAVMAHANFCSPEIRQPLLPLEDANLQKILTACDKYGVSL